MPIAQEISESLIRENITRAIGEVFKTMLSQQFKLADFVGQGHGHAQAEIVAKVAAPQIVGTVGFIGDANGLLYLYLDEEFANLCTGQMLGMSQFELKASGNEVVNDAIGELTNMVVGTFKNGLCDAGFPCKLTIPSILRGRSFTIDPISSAQRRIYCFEGAGHWLVTDIIMKSGDC